MRLLNLKRVLLILRREHTVDVAAPALDRSRDVTSANQAIDPVCAATSGRHAGSGAMIRQHLEVRRAIQR